MPFEPLCLHSGVAPSPLWFMRVFEAALLRSCSTVSEMKLCTAPHEIAHFKSEII